MEGLGKFSAVEKIAAWDVGPKRFSKHEPWNPDRPRYRIDAGATPGAFIINLTQLFSRTTMRFHASIQSAKTVPYTWKLTSLSVDGIARLGLVVTHVFGP